jgi:ribonuclease HI
VSTAATNTWSPPQPGTVLINSDDAIFEASGSMGAGVVVHNHHGTCLVACRQHLHGSPPPELAEALALRRAVELARDEGFDQAIFESDYLSLVHRMNSQLMDRSSVGITSAGIKHLVKDFLSVYFRHVKRVFNEAAHRLPKSSENVNSSFTFYFVPDFVRETLCNIVV